MIKKLRNQFFSETNPPDNLEESIFVSYRRPLNKSLQGKKHSFRERMEIAVEGQGSEISLNEICNRENISPLTFEMWTQELLDYNSIDAKGTSDKLSTSDIHKFNLVLEGKSGETSVAEICRREKISHDTFLDWSSTFLQLRNRKLEEVKKDNSQYYEKNKHLVSRRASPGVFEYIQNYVDLTSKSTLIVLKSSSLRLDYAFDLKSLISLQRINDVRYINKYFEKVNSKLEQGGIFVGCLETFTARRHKRNIDKIPMVNNIYFGFEFLVKRILPKISFTKKHYFDITKGNDRLLSKAEGLGRLVSCGFKIMDFKSIDGLVYFIVKKVSEPKFDRNPSYGPLYKMPRLGKNGKIIGVYKFRTMHPYSEYLQDYIVNAHGYSKTGKPADDFRIPRWGKIMRRFWLDEIPQLLNVLRGELKLVGVRPVSQRYFQDIPKEMQKLRLIQKPGCIPPYVALNRSGNVMSVLQSEKEYLDDKIRSPYTTDMRYFFNALFNIIFRHKRSA